MTITADSLPAERDELVALLRHAASAYYGGDGSEVVMDDATYDAGIALLRRFAEDDPSWRAGEDLLGAVAGGTGDGDVPHAVPMLSLDNVFSAEELQRFLARIAQLAGSDPEAVRYVVEPKLDGLALALTYVDGRFVRAVLRGNGIAGEDATTNARTAAGVPERISRPGLLEVRGECVMTADDFARANTLREQAGKAAFKNARNAVAGAMRTVHRDVDLPMTFVAYGVVGLAEETSHLEAMAALRALGFTTADAVSPLGPCVVTGAELASAKVAEMDERRYEMNIEIDGAVLKADEPAVRAACGEGSRAPRWAIAYKFEPDKRATDLLDIEVGIGRTGNLSFTAKVAPVHVGGVTISSVTVHNPSQIALKGLRLPGPDGAVQQVWVRRAGEVIPEIVGPVAEDSPGTVAFVPPSACPRCGGSLDASGKIWRCARGRECAVEENVLYAVGRDQLDILLGDERVSALVVSGRVRDVADLFTLGRDDLLAIDRMGEKNAAKVLETIESARRLPMHRVLTALGVAGTGRSLSRRIARAFGSMAALRAASVEQLATVEGVGTEKSVLIASELVELAPVLERLAEMGIGQDEPGVGTTAAAAAAGPLAGETVVVTGTVPGLSRNAAREAVERLGGKSASSVSSKTTLAVIGDGAGSNADKAEKLGVRTMSAADFAALAAASA